MTFKRLVVPGVIVLQFTVPLTAAIISEPPTRLGFQMYSGLSTLDITVADARGREMDVDLLEHVATWPREELDWTVRLPETLCEVPGAATVTVSQASASRTVRC